MRSSVLRLAFSIAAGLSMILTAAAIPIQAPSVSETTVSPTADHFPQNKQNESPMAVNPQDPQNAISGANDEKLEPDCTLGSSGASSCPFAPGVNTSGIYVTTDGGATWAQQILDWSSANLTSDGDPVVAFGPKPDGHGGFNYDHGARAYFGSLAGSPDFGPNQELLAVSSSDDQGTTWGPPVLATTRQSPVSFNDKISLWVDQNSDSPHFGTVYVAWTLFTGNFPPASYGRESNVYLPEPIMISRSTDGGQTFSKPVKLTPSHNNGQVGGRQGSAIRTTPNGDVYVFYDGASNKQSAILGVKSTDGGAHFGRPFLVSLKNDVPSPFPGASFRTDSFPLADVDAQGTLYITWADYTSGHSVVKLARSTDGGQTWISATAANVPGRSAFYPAVAVSGTHVFIGFNAIDDVASGAAPGAGVVSYDAYYVLSNDGGGAFGAPVKISAAPSDPDVASANGLSSQFIGDYNGAAAGPDGSFWFSWTDTRAGATCAAVDAYRAGGPKPDIYSQCPAGFGDSDIVVAHVTP